MEMHGRSVSACVSAIGRLAWCAVAGGPWRVRVWRGWRSGPCTVPVVDVGDAEPGVPSTCPHRIENSRHDMAVTPAPAVLRALDVLEFLADRPQGRFTLTELAREVGLPRATCQAVLLSLAGRGYVVRDDESMTYALGPACLRLGEAAAEAAPIFADAEREARKLAAVTGLSVATAVRASTNVAIVSACAAADRFAPSARTGDVMPLTAPFGAALVAWSEPEVVEAWLTTDPPMSERERSRHRKALEVVRVRGCSISVASAGTDALAGLYDFEKLTEAEIAERRAAVVRAMARAENLADDDDLRGTRRVSQMSAPVFDHHGRLVLALMLVGPSHELSPDSIRSLSQLLLDAAATASRAPRR